MTGIAERLEVLEPSRPTRCVVSMMDAVGGTLAALFAAIARTLHTSRRRTLNLAQRDALRDC